MTHLFIQESSTLVPTVPCATKRKCFPHSKECVERLAGLLVEQADALADLMAREIGKPVRFGRVEAQRTSEKLRAVLHRSTNYSLPTGDPVVRRRPHGTVAVITPYNNPIYLSLGKIVPAVIYGNKVAWKPAPEATLLSRRLFELLDDAGWPEGLVRLCEGGRDAAVDLMNDPKVAAVTITGSSAAGSSAQEICGRRRIPLQAELGGNNAAIVWSDADVPAAARLIAAGAFEMAGQRCTANRRAIVHTSCREAFFEALLHESAALHCGDPLHPQTQVGPLVSLKHRDRVADIVARAQNVGRVSRPVRTQTELAAFYPPTIICCDDPDHEIVQEETFGPVLVVQTAHTWEHAMSLCNGVRQGLAAAIFSNSPHIVERFLDEAQAGILKVNQSTSDAAVDVPFGGWKASGVGLPEHGVFDMEFCTRPQTVYDTGRIGGAQ